MLCDSPPHGFDTFMALSNGLWHFMEEQRTKIASFWGDLEFQSAARAALSGFVLRRNVKVHIIVLWGPTAQPGVQRLHLELLTETCKLLNCCLEILAQWLKPFWLQCGFFASMLPPSLERSGRARPISIICASSLDALCNLRRSRMVLCQGPWRTDL